jgi:membrane-associated protein
MGKFIGRTGSSRIGEFMIADILLQAQFHWSQLLQPQFYIEHGGLWLILFVVFAETGLFVGFFLPGDSLLFVAGIYSSNLAQAFIPTGNEYVDLFFLLVLISIAGILGNTVGYWFGRKVGPTMYEWKENVLFKRKYLRQAHDFYEKHGGGAIVIARFIPIVRTFAPIVAGIVQMNHRKFMVFNVIGCIAWVFSMLFGGHFLQKWILAEFGFDLKEHLEVIVLGIVLVTTAPVAIKLFSSRKHPSSPDNKP